RRVPVGSNRAAGRKRSRSGKLRLVSGAPAGSFGAGAGVIVASADAHRLIPDCKVSVDGKKLALDKDARLTRVEVDLDVDLFSQCSLVFNDPKLTLINGPDFKAGVPVKVEI